MKHLKNGFSLIEVMIVVAIVAVLITISYPSYAKFVRKSHRSEAQITLLDWANRQEIWRADHTAYNEAFNPPDTEYYTYSMVSTATTYTLTATAIGLQVHDQEAGVDCPSLTLNQAGAPGPTGHEKCWSK